MNDAANVAKLIIHKIVKLCLNLAKLNLVILNQHLIMDAEILEIALNEIMACNRSVAILENRNFHEGLGSKLVLRCNSSRYTSETSFHSTHKNEKRKSYQINTFSTLGMRTLGKGRNEALKFFAILNLGKPVSHFT